MTVDLKQLQHLITKRQDKIEKIVAGSGYLPRTVIGVGTFLLDNEGNSDLLTAKQRVTFERFLQPLLEDAQDSKVRHHP
ncbi:MAG: hypothetical protein GW875_12545 [Deltaproteobacteria bacterium]|nr:hypothetical protein [Deltaproteobacteria bacterium]